MWAGTQAIAGSDRLGTYDQFIGDVASPYEQRIMMHMATNGGDVDEAIGTATGVGMLLSDSVGTTSVEEAIVGQDYSTGASLTGIERTQRGLMGASQLVGTGAGIGAVASSANAATSSILARTTNVTVARGAGLLTTRVGSGFAARAATRMNVSGNLAASRAARTARNYSGFRPVEPSVTGAYARPSHATTPEQRAVVQGQACVDCGKVAPTMVADHKLPLVIEHYTTGKIN